MKRLFNVAIVLLLSMTLTGVGAFAQGNGAMGEGQQSGHQTQNQSAQFMQYGLGDPIFINAGAIEDAVNQLQDREQKQTLLRLLEQYQTCTAGESLAEEQEALLQLRNGLAAAGVEVPGSGPQDFSYAYGRECGRFLNTEWIAYDISMITDEQIAAGLTALLDAYLDAVDAKDVTAIQETLEALMSGLADAQLQVDDYTGLQLYKATQGLYLDAAAIEAAINTLTDQDTVNHLYTLLDTYMLAAYGGGTLAAQEALIALTDALEAAGIPI